MQCLAFASRRRVACSRAFALPLQGVARQGMAAPCFALSHLALPLPRAAMLSLAVPLLC